MSISTNLGIWVCLANLSPSAAIALTTLIWGRHFAPNLSYAAIDVYDITNPHQPIWLAAVDSTSSLPIHMFTYGNYLVLVDSGYIVPVPSRISIYDIQNQVPVLQSVVNLPELAISTVNDGVIYGFGQPAVTGSTTVPVYTFDIRSGSVIQTEYNLPPPSGAAGIVTGFISITGSGNMIYASQSHPDGGNNGKALDAFDISTSPPSLVTWVPSGDAGFELRAVNQLVFADFKVFDFSTANPTMVGSFSMINVQAVQGNQVLALGYHFDYLVIDVSNPATPVETEDVADVASENPFFNPYATLGEVIFSPLTVKVVSQYWIFLSAVAQSTNLLTRTTKQMLPNSPKSTIRCSSRQTSIQRDLACLGVLEVWSPSMQAEVPRTR